MDKVYIFGHKNPDTDSVCGAIVLSYLKNQLGMDTEPRILSPINEETRYVLDKFKIPVPNYLNDVKVQIKDVNFHKNYMINENKTIFEAFNYMNANGITGLPLVDDAKKFKGYVSLKEIAADMIYNENLLVSTSFENILNVLEATDYLQFDEHISGYAHAATFNDETFINNIPIDEETILIVGDREKIIRYAISKKVKMIILVKGQKLSAELKKLAKEAHINVIFTNKSSFKIARVLCLANPIKTIKRNQMTITFNANAYLTDFEEETSHLKHTNYPIIDNRNRCLGMLRTIDAHEVKRKKLILVDHNMFGQSIDGLYEAEILEIIDHHNIGDINTNHPINFRNMAVGSVCTIIYYLYQESNIKIPKKMAGLMLSGIVSDTLMLQSPTTTPKDRLVAEKLTKMLNIDFRKFALEILSSGVSIENMSANEILFRDFKTYKAGEYEMAIGQVFTVDFNVFKPRLEELIEELNRTAMNHEYKCCCLFVTNFLTNNSYVLFSENSQKILENAYGINDLEEGHLMRGIVSRKQQMVPHIMNIVEHM